MQIPDYMEYFVACYGKPFAEILVSIESSFNALGYEKHLDIIDGLFMYKDIDELRPICEKGLDIYREHIFDALMIQGIRLLNYKEDKLSELSKILMGTVILGNSKLEDITNGELIEVEDDDELWFLNLLSMSSNLSVDELHMYIDYVDIEIIDYLRDHETIAGYEVASNASSRNRFLKIMGDKKEGVVVAAIKDHGTFNYNPDVFLKTVIDELENIVDEVQLRREIKLLIAGSNMRDLEKMKEWASTTVEHIKHEPKIVYSINSKWDNFEDLII
jgi:hypothetical protein